MKFSVYLPPKAVAGEKVPALLYLAGLTCTEETFMTKAGAQRLAAELNIALICARHQPARRQRGGRGRQLGLWRGRRLLPGRPPSPWALHWRMESYLIDELLPVGSKLPWTCSVWASSATAWAATAR
jgi:S-formylglutathione hydrolase